MFIAQGLPPDPGSIKMVLLLIAILAVVFWKTVIKLVLIGALLLVLYGALMAVQGLH